MLRGGLRMLRCMLRLRRDRLACGTYLVGECQSLQPEADPSRHAGAKPRISSARAFCLASESGVNDT